MCEPENDILTVSDLMEILYIGQNYAYKLLNEGKIRAFRVGKSWRIPRSSINEFIYNSCNHQFLK